MINLLKDTGSSVLEENQCWCIKSSFETELIATGMFNSSTYGDVSPSVSRAWIFSRQQQQQTSARQPNDKMSFPALNQFKWWWHFQPNPPINKNRGNFSFKLAVPNSKSLPLSSKFCLRLRFSKKDAWKIFWSNLFGGWWICDIIQMSLHFSKTYVNERLRFSDG